MTLRLAHLSDLHFGEAPPALVESLAADVIAAAPDAILASGDLTRRAEPEEFAAALGFLRRFGVPVLTVPGNHDIPRHDLVQRFLSPHRRWQAAEMGAREGVLDLGAASVIGVDTVRRAHWRHLDWSAGGVSDRRLLLLSERLRRAAGRPVIVMCHHPLRHPAWATGRHPPAGAAAVLGLLREAGVRAVLSGHLHRAEGLGEGPRQFIAPSALSPRLKRARNGWLLATLDEAGLRVEAREEADGAWSGRLI